MKSLAFGEILWDIIEGTPHLGGAPFNVAAHLAQLGGNSFILSAVGSDELGRKALAKANEIGVHTPLVGTVEGKSTGTVDVFLTNGQPDYTIHEDVAWDYIPYTPDTDTVKKEQWDTLIFGSLALRTAHNIRTITTLLRHNTFQRIFFDINLRKDYYAKDLFEMGFSLCNVLKLNDDEVNVVSPLLFGKLLTETEFAKEVAQAFQIDIVLITQGGEGAFAYSNNRLYHAKGESITVADTVGAGDSFSAAFLYTLHQRGDLQQALQNACAMGGYVASKTGAIPPYPEAIKRLFA